MTKKLIAVLLALACVCALFSACAKPEKQIVGTWNGEANLFGVVADYTFTFNEGGTGTMKTALDIGVSMTYTITEEKLSITTSILGIANTTDYTYSFGKNTLTLNDGEHEIVLTKAD